MTDMSCIYLAPSNRCSDTNPKYCTSVFQFNPESNKYHQCRISSTLNGKCIMSQSNKCQDQIFAHQKYLVSMKRRAEQSKDRFIPETSSSPSIDSAHSSRYGSDLGKIRAQTQTKPPTTDVPSQRRPAHPSSSRRPPPPPPTTNNSISFDNVDPHG